jgi:hypothetical protein
MAVNGPELNRFASITAHSSPIVGLETMPNGIFSIGGQAMRLHTRGGVLKHEFECVHILASIFTLFVLPMVCVQATDMQHLPIFHVVAIYSHLRVIITFFSALTRGS